MPPEELPLLNHGVPVRLPIPGAGSTGDIWGCSGWVSPPAKHPLSLRWGGLWHHPPPG